MYLKPVNHKADKINISRDIADKAAEDDWGNKNDVAETHAEESQCHSHLIILYLLL